MIQLGMLYIYVLILSTDNDICDAKCKSLIFFNT